MKTKLLMLAFIAIFFAACTTDQDEIISDAENVTLITSNDLLAYESDPSDSAQTRDTEGCRSAGDYYINIRYNFTLTGGTPLPEWKEEIRQRFVSYGFVRHNSTSLVTEKWLFDLDLMSNDHINLDPNGCRNNVIRAAIEADHDVSVDGGYGCQLCFGS